MATCAFCGTTLIFGGKREGDLRFCNDKCVEKGAVLIAADQLPQELLDEYVQKIHTGTCPICQGDGPVDVHTSHRVWSALLITSWYSRPQICCRSCGNKSKTGDILFSLLLGWWGFPWGILATPIQVSRNLMGFAFTPTPDKPSKQLGTMVALNIAQRAAQGEADPSV